ncbi:MAG: glutamate--tRNA ligase [Deltaproteobacteria bacterium]|nr:glutamate--tRNA ligase [Deltaproteobacteria bacterium]
MSQARTRFSPSPTGSLHLGGAHTALFNWLIARRHQGVFILRIEDTDKERSQERFVEEILDSLTWLGLPWDEGPYRQSERLHVYNEYIEKLLERDGAYYCDCPPGDLEARRQEALARGEKPKYDGRCRERGLKKGPDTAVRFKTPLTGVTFWHDLIKGHIAFDNRELDDLVLARADGIPTYNFAVVVDDITMAVTHVIRGDDHVPNTPRQLLIYQALEAPPPRFAHMPLMLGKDRAKLSKRHGALSILTYREMGFLPPALNNYLARLGWSHGDQEIFTMEELIQYFSLEHVTKSAGIFDEEKLLWLNSHYIKETPLPELARLLVPFLARIGIETPDPQYLARVTGTLNTRSKTLVDMAERALFYFRDPSVYDEKAAKKFLTPEAAPLLEEISRRLEALPEATEEALNLMFKELEAETGLKMGKLAQPVRVALTGKSESPGLFEIISILGKQVTRRRIRRAVEFIQEISHKG